MKERFSYEKEGRLKVLECAKTLGNREVAKKFGIDEKTVRRWKRMSEKKEKNLKPKKKFNLLDLLDQIEAGSGKEKDTKGDPKSSVTSTGSTSSTGDKRASASSSQKKGSAKSVGSESKGGNGSFQKHETLEDVSLSSTPKRRSSSAKGKGKKGDSLGAPGSSGGKRASGEEKQTSTDSKLCKGNSSASDRSREGKEGHLAVISTDSTKPSKKTNSDKSTKAVKRKRTKAGAAEEPNSGQQRDVPEAVEQGEPPHERAGAVKKTIKAESEAEELNSGENETEHCVFGSPSSLIIDENCKETDEEKATESELECTFPFPSKRPNVVRRLLLDTSEDEFESGFSEGGTFTPEPASTNDSRTSTNISSTESQGQSQCSICSDWFVSKSCHYTKVEVSLGGLKRRLCQYFDIDMSEVCPTLEGFLRREKFPFCSLCFTRVYDLYRRGEQARTALSQFYKAQEEIVKATTAGISSRQDRSSVSYSDLKQMIIQKGASVEGKTEKSGDFYKVPSCF